MTWCLLILAALIGLLAYVRLAPSDPARWHVALGDMTDSTGVGSARRVLSAREGLFATLDTAMRALPRTTVLAGSVQEGHVTYITRTKLIGFPDYTTIEEKEDEVRMFARLRFGRSDLGVNAKRLDGLIAALPK